MKPPRLSVFKLAALPLTHALLTGAFVLGNAAIGATVLGGSVISSRLVAVFVVVALVFSRQRLLCALRRAGPDDEFISRREVTIVSFGTVAVEAVLAFQLGAAALAAWAATLGFTFIAANEFFLGTWLRGRWELRVLLSSVRAVFLGAFVVSGASGAPFSALGLLAIGLAVANWALMGLYLLARRVFGRDGEVRRGLSEGLTPVRAASLCSALILVANGFLLLAPLPGSTLIVGASAVAVLVAFFYASEPRLDRAVIFRVTMTGFFLSYYAGLASTPWLS